VVIVFLAATALGRFSVIGVKEALAHAGPVVEDLPAAEPHETGAARHATDDTTEIRRVNETPTENGTEVSR